MASRCYDGIFSISPLLRQAHEVADGLWLAAFVLLLEVASDKTVPKGIDGSFGRNIFCCVAEGDPS
jgi:hypothetical protein